MRIEVYYIIELLFYRYVWGIDSTTLKKYILKKEVRNPDANFLVVVCLMGTEKNRSSCITANGIKEWILNVILNLKSKVQHYIKV